MIFQTLTYDSKDVRDAVHRVRFAGTRPEVEEIVYVDFEVLQVIAGEVADVVLQLVQGGQLHVRHHTALLIRTPHDASGETETHDCGTSS